MWNRFFLTIWRTEPNRREYVIVYGKSFKSRCRLVHKGNKCPMNCPRCATVNSENAKFCKGCGIDLRDVAKLEPVLSANGLRCLKCGVENRAHAKFCKACGILASHVPPLPVTPPVPVRATEILNGVSCYKCKTINNPNAKFCKSCGVLNPASPPAPQPQSVKPDEPKKPPILWAGIAAGIFAIAGGGAYWMFIGGAKPKTASTAPAPLPQAASSAPVHATLPASASTNVPATPTTGATTATTAAAEPSKAATSAQDAAKADNPQAATPAHTPPLVIAKPTPDETKQGPTQAERDVREAVRKKQAERDQLTKQKERDKANMNKANRTLDDLLK